MAFFIFEINWMRDIYGSYPEKKLFVHIKMLRPTVFRFFLIYVGTINQSNHFIWQLFKYWYYFIETARLILRATIEMLSNMIRQVWWWAIITAIRECYCTSDRENITQLRFEETVEESGTDHEIQLPNENRRRTIINQYSLINIDLRR